MADQNEPRWTPPDDIGFAIVMCLAAILGRENPRFVYPYILWSFLAFFAFNLANFKYLNKRLDAAARLRLAVGGNIVLLSLVLLFSGGRESYFWVMYLLPVFTGALSFEGKGALTPAGIVLGVLTLFHSEGLSRGSLPELIAWATKAATIGTSAVVVRRVAARDRESRRRLLEEQQRIAQERSQMRDRMQHMDRLATLGTLTASITHELNTPLTSILGFTELGLAQGKDDDSRDLLVRVRRNAENCRRIISDMLAFARSRKAPRGPSDLNALVGDCVKLKKVDWALGSTAVQEEYGAGLPQVTVCGPELQQVVFNLLSNAYQAIQGAGIQEGLIKVRTAGEDGQALISVSDNGPGVPPELLARLGEPFLTTKAEGTGLGLSISRQIVEAHGGKLEASSRPGEGTSFTIRLPIDSKEAA